MANMPSFGAIESTTLQNLPSDIIFSILDFLPLSSVALLALTSRRMLYRVDGLYSPFRKIGTRGQEVQSAKFLLHFDALFPDKWICFACGVFHPRYVVDHQRAWPRRCAYRPYLCAFNETFYARGLQGLDIARTLWRWSDFQMIMRALKHSPAYGDIRPLNQYYPPGGDWFQMMYARESFAMVVDGHLLLRQRWTRGIPCHTSWGYYFITPHQLCPHICHPSVGHIQFYQSFTALLEQAVQHSEDHSEDFAEGATYDRGLIYKALRCSACPTELVVEVLPTTLRRGPMADSIRICPRVLSITRYIDLGPFHGPDDAEWAALTTPVHGSDSVAMTQAAEHVDKATTSQTNPCDFTKPEPIAFRMGESLSLQAQIPHHEAVQLAGETAQTSMRAWNVTTKGRKDRNNTGTKHDQDRSHSTWTRNSRPMPLSTPQTNLLTWRMPIVNAALGY